MIQLTDEVRDAVDRSADLLPQLIAAGVVFAVLLVVGRLAGSGLRRMVGARSSSRLAAIAGRVVHWAFALLGLVVALQILGLTAIAGSLLATGGLMAVILGFAFRSIGENLLAGVFIGFSRAFDVGDVIESSGHIGVVRAINLRSVHIRSADGRDIFVPCTQIFTNVLINYTGGGLRRGEFMVGIDYADDPDMAREILLRATRAVPGVLADPAPMTQISAFNAQYQELAVYFWVDTRGKVGLGDIRSAAMRACLTALRGAGVTLSSDVSTAVSLHAGDVAIKTRESEANESDSRL